MAERLGDVIASLYDQAAAPWEEPAMSLALRLLDGHVPAVAARRPAGAVRHHRGRVRLPGPTAPRARRRRAAGATREFTRTRPRPPWGTGGPARAPRPAGASRPRARRPPPTGLRLQATEDAMAAARVVYGLLDIDLRGTRDGEITVRRCPFSGEVYSAEVCRLVGALDSACCWRPVRRRPPGVHPADHRGRAVLPGPAAPRREASRFEDREASGMRTVIVVGAGGATVARELQGAFEVTVLEAGRPSAASAWNARPSSGCGTAGCCSTPPSAPPSPQVRRTGDMYLVNGIGVGGTTLMATGNGIRADGAIRPWGSTWIRVRPDRPGDPPVHRPPGPLHPTTGACSRPARAELNLAPRPIPKMTTGQACRHCGRCVSSAAPWGRGTAAATWTRPPPGARAWSPAAGSSA